MTLPRLRVAFLTEGAPGELECPSSTFRVGSFLEGLERLGIEPMILPARPNKFRNGPPSLPSAFRSLSFPFYNALRLARRIADVPRSARADVVFLQRELLPIGPPIVEQAIARRNPRLVFDLDDAIYLPPPPPFASLVPAGRAERIARLARVVTAGSSVLAEWARPLAPKVRTIPTGVDTERFRPTRRTPASRPVVTWIGQPSNLQELVGIAEGLRGAHRRVPFLLRVVTRLPAGASLEGLDVEWRPYADASHPELAADADVAIMPLADTAWNRGKCGAKLLFSMACGVPVVASGVGANREIVVPGECGFLADGPEAWAEAVSGLIESPGLRRRLGEGARTRVEEHYSVRALLPRLASAIREAAS